MLDLIQQIFFISEMQKELSARSDRVKSVDIYPAEVECKSYVYNRILTYPLSVHFAG